MMPKQATNKRISQYVKPDEAPLYLPLGYIDNSHLITNFDVRGLVDGQRYVFQAFLAKPPTTKFKQGQPYTTFTIIDGSQYPSMLQFTLFGDVRPLVEELIALPANTPFFVAGDLSLNQIGAYINNAQIIKSESVGTVEAVYPGIPGKVKPENIKLHIQKNLSAFLPVAAGKVRSSLAKVFASNADLRKYLGVKTKTLEELLVSVHLPQTMDEAEEAMRVMQRIGAVSAASDLIELARQASAPKTVAPIVGAELADLVRHIPFRLTDEQEGIVERTIRSIRYGELLDMVLIGDVGTGKTVCYAIPASYVATGGGRVAILLPNTNLATQIYTEFCSYFPALNDRTLLVTGESDASNETLQAASVLIGTTAMLFREVGLINLCVVDEQQKMSSLQRTQLCHQHTHQISVSATPIPRTTALATYGAVRTEIIRHCHAVKTVHTRILEPDQFQTLINEVLWTVQSEGKQALIVCARKEDSQSDDDQAQVQPISAEEAFEIFNQLMPGRVALSHGGLSQEQNHVALNAMRQGEMRILVATTVVEIGVTLPDLTYAAVLDAERFSLNQLHQLRGRLVRKGGTGYFSLYLQRHSSNHNPRTIQRLTVLIGCSDGHNIAKQDLLLRGVGDLRQGSTQHGRYQGLILNAQVDIELMEKLLAEFA